MTLKVIGLGLGRTGTNSLRLALNQLGLGPCHHMEEVLENQSSMVPQWADAVNGKPDWPEIYKGYNSACDWPTAAFTTELYAAYPRAKYVLTIRSAESWLASFGETIYKFMGAKNQLPAEMMTWYAMAEGMLKKSDFKLGMTDIELKLAFAAHNDFVRATIPARQLLVFEVKQGWPSLCNFLNLPPPETPFPRSNDRTEFWNNLPPVK